MSSKMFPFFSVNKLIMHTLRFFLCPLTVDNAFVLKENLCQGMGTFRCGRTYSNALERQNGLYFFYRDVKVV